METFLICFIRFQVKVDYKNSNDGNFIIPDFLVFKELFVDYNIMKRNHESLNLSDLLSVSSFK